MHLRRQVVKFKSSSSNPTGLQVGCEWPRCIVIITVCMYFKYMRKEFLPYSEKWKESVACRAGFEDAGKK